MLISASCWAHAGYSRTLRPGQTGSPMIRTRPVGRVSAKARSTPGMMRPGLRPARSMSTQCTSAPRGPNAARNWAIRGGGTATATGSPAAIPSSRKGTVAAVYSRAFR